jgi:GNAT superfamily N-acetyltransferase
MSRQSHPLLLELERIERLAWADLAAVAPTQLAQDIGLQTAQIHHAFFFMASRIPQVQFNWLSGAGLNGDDGRSISEAVGRFRGAGQLTFFIQLPPGPHVDQCVACARAEGLEEHPLAWAKFHRTTADAPVVTTTLVVREIGAGERDLFTATAIAGFGMPAPMGAWLGQLVGREHWHTYVSFAGDQPVGAAALYVRGEFAWLGIGATRPEARKQGSQSALLARRLADAAKLGARHAATETGVPQPGQPAPSYSNILKAGFSVAYVRPNWSEPQ